MAARYGAGSNVYRVRVEGEFPLADDDSVVPAHLIAAAMDRDIEPSPTAPSRTGPPPRAARRCSSSINIRPMTPIRSAVHFLAAALAAGAASAVLAQSYPDKPVRILVGYPPGGASDAVARQLAFALSARMGQNFVLDNRGGGGGRLGHEDSPSACGGYLRVGRSAVRAPCLRSGAAGPWGGGTGAGQLKCHATGSGGFAGRPGPGHGVDLGQPPHRPLAPGGPAGPLSGAGAPLKGAYISPPWPPGPVPRPVTRSAAVSSDGPDLLGARPLPGAGQRALWCLLAAGRARSPFVFRSGGPVSS